MPGRILIVDDDKSMCDLLRTGLGRRGFEAEAFTDGESAFQALLDGDYDVLVTDLNMRGMGGIELCERVVANRRDVPVVVITAFGSFDTAVAAIRAGAYDFVTKPFDMETIEIALERAVRHRRLSEEVKRLRRAEERAQGFEEMVGDSPAMRQLYDLLDRIADTDATVLVTGESGTGKELVARAIHRRSRRAAGPFVPVNCGAIPESLMESELFGHVRGAFTDARQARTGLFVQAGGGTIFLDEIGETPLSLQPKLLRVLQERVVRPVGANQEAPFDARVVVATNRDLEEAIEQGRFREDLWFRINVIHVEMPPLRSRGGDVLLLAQQFLTTFSNRLKKSVHGISKGAAEKLLSYGWPGNVRELQNCMERAVALTRFEEITVEDLPERIRSYRRSHVVIAAEDPSELLPMDEVERRYILRVLETVDGNKTIAARILGLDRKTLYRKLERWGLDGGSSGP